MNIHFKWKSETEHPEDWIFLLVKNPVNSSVKWKILKLFTSYNNFWIKKEQLAGL